MSDRRENLFVLWGPVDNVPTIKTATAIFTRISEGADLYTATTFREALRIAANAEHARVIVVASILPCEKIKHRKFQDRTAADVIPGDTEKLAGILAPLPVETLYDPRLIVTDRAGIEELHSGYEETCEMTALQHVQLTEAERITYALLVNSLPDK